MPALRVLESAMTTLEFRISEGMTLSKAPIPDIMSLSEKGNSTLKSINLLV
ncbi:MAG: hypothetical protein IPL53_19400 [Ignavibacteria bacterium]|nr:hypothetical protein [Ignavibacteria bacterium]